ncbi:Na+/H+ antiporter NhaC family protein [bacterium BMS3Abin03]|nr:Na+/H+ antiporter NhaC family protein [bacterium BMS3Abin03]MCG6959764.1 Na+/H+ antiporter NhaC family protein [bacterium BMS3Abin03]
MGENLTENISSVEMIVNSDEGMKKYKINVHGGNIDTVFTLDKSGDYYFSFEGFSSLPEKIRVIPGWLSIIPPLLAILLALLFRQVILSLILGIYAGAVFIYDYNPINGFLRLLDVYIINAASDISHVQIIIFTLLFGGMIGIMSKSGGTRGIANVITKFARTRKSTLISAWFSGLVIFFDDYANTLIVGNLMRPVTDKMRISREKLSFIVDATAAPVASIFIISSWIGYEVGLIQDGLKIIGSEANAYSTFLATIPFRFYPIMMLVFVFMISYFRRDFGPMYKAEIKAINQDKPAADNLDSSQELEEASKIFGNEEKAKWYNGIIPIVVIIIGTVVGLIYTGINSLNSQGITNYGIREIISNSDSYLSLLWSSFGACVVAAVMVLSQKIMNLSETINAWILGIKSMLLAVLILTLAWSIGAITVEMRTADYIIGLISDSISPHYLPVIVFLVCALTSFATGTSWGTMAIMMPIVIPLSHTVSGFYNLSPADTTLILNGVISSVLAGCVFGDHCSPISDTTILSSMASRCNHVDHVRTQLPYAIAVALFCMLLGDIPTAFGLSPYISLVLIGIVLFVVIFTIGKKVSTN